MCERDALPRFLLDRTHQDAIILDYPARVHGFTIRAGEYPLDAVGNGVQSYRINPTDVLRTARLATRRPIVGLRTADSRPGQLCLRFQDVANSLCAEANFQRAAVTVPNREAFHMELLYSGRHGTKLKVDYREFGGDHARPAFYNSVEYDMSRSRLIGYKGARIEVVSFSNESIQYRVLNSFGGAQPLPQRTEAAPPASRQR